VASHALTREGRFVGWSTRDLVALGLESHIAQVSNVTNVRRGTIRGLHYQADPFGEAKTLWCVAGSVFDVIVDLRIEEPTYGKWLSMELSADEPWPYTYLVRRAWLPNL